MSVQSLIWVLIASMGAVDYILFAAQGMTVTIRWASVFGSIFLYGLSVVYRRRAPPVARAATSAAQIVAFSNVGAILTYAAMAASPFPMADALLSHADSAIGFDWIAWFNLVNDNPKLHFVLALAYASAPAQGIGLIAYFSRAEPKRVDEFLLAGILSIILIVPIMVLLPAVGAWSQHGVGLVEPWRGDILALRSHALPTVDEMQGIISFPSFHTVLGVLFANMARGRKWFLPMLVLNLTLLASVMSEGAHYGVDMLGGLAVAWVAVVASRSILRCCAHNDVMMILTQLVGSKKGLVVHTARSEIFLADRR